MLNGRRLPVSASVALSLALWLLCAGAFAPSTAYAYDGPVHDYDLGGAVDVTVEVSTDDLAAPPVRTPAVSVGYVCDPPRFSVATNTIRYGPTNPGPLNDAVVATFRSGSYSEVVLDEATTLYRVYGGEAGQLGSYWSRTAPTGPMQAQIDLALNPEWGNLATDVASIRVPAGTTIFEGAVAAQSLPAGGALLGGGSQVYIPRVNPDWLLP